MIYELLLCGSGQLIHVYGSLTLRMALFFIAFIWVFCIKNGGRADKRIWHISIIFILLHLFGLAMNVFNGGSLEYAFLDIKPLIYFLCILPFWHIPNGILRNVPKMIITSSLLMSVIYLIYIIMIKNGIGGVMLDFDSTYDSMTEELDFMFRGNGGELFYTGFLFLPIGAVFSCFYIRDKRYKVLILVLISIAIYFTLTRAFYLLFLIGMVISTYLHTKNKLLFIFIIAFSLLVSFSFLMSTYGILFDDRDSGDKLRILTYNQVIERINFCSLFLGHGLGIGVPAREVHMECSYLEIFHKQGLLGLSFWIVYLLYCIRSIKKIHIQYKCYYYPFIISIVLICIQSIFNPYLNNPIGLWFINISLVIILKQQRNDKCMYSNL